MAKNEGAQYDDAIQFAAKEFGVNPDILHGIAYAESRYNANTPPSSAGAQGLMQFMPGTAKRFGINPKDPEQAIFAAAKYLKDNLTKFNGDYAKAVAGYNWGENRDVFNREDWAANLPKETDKYVENVLSYAAGRAKPAQQKPTTKPTTDAIPSGRGDVPEWGRKHPELYGIAGAAREVLGPIIEAGGALLGGLGGTTAGAVGGPVGAAAGGVAGAAGGYAAGKEITNLADIALGNVAPQTLAQAPERMKKAALEGATMEVGGRLAAPVIAKGAKMIGAGYNMLSPKAAAYLEAAEGKGKEILNALRGNVEIVPGSVPTAAEAASGVGSTKFSAMGAAAEKLKSTEAVAQRDAQKAAQLAAVRTVGGTKAELEAAEAVRKATAEKLYGVSDEALLPGRERQFKAVKAGETPSGVATEAETGAPRMVEVGRNPLTNEPIMQPVTTAGGVPVYKQVLAGYKYDKNLAKLLERPAIQSAFDSAATIAENRGVSLFTKDGQLTGEGAHLVKLALDDAAMPVAGATPLGTNALNALNSAKSTYLKWVEEMVPAYKTARETFAAQSKPINQMQVGQYLEGKLKPILGEETAKLRSGQFVSAIDQAPQTLKKATGQPRFNQLEEILTPEQMKVINDVRADLERQARTEYLAKQGAGSMSIEKIASRAAEGAKAPHIMSRIVTVANDILGRLAGKMDKKLAIEIATEMLDPKLAAQALEKAMKHEARGAAIAKPFKAAGQAAKKVQEKAGGTTAAINTLNALINGSSFEKNQNALVQ